MIEKWHDIIKHRDLNALQDLLAEDVDLHSPIVHHPLSSKKVAYMYLTAAFHTFLNDDFHYVRECFSENNAVLEFETEIDGIHVNGVDMIRWNNSGKIVDFKVMIRPLKAVNLIHQKMAELLEKSKA